MSFIGVYRAVYDYSPQSDEELEISEGDLLFVLEKSSEDDWWKCKKKAANDDDDEPEGLVPSNYVEQARPTHSARALYDYTKQTDEELSFQEGSVLSVYDQTDPDWTLVGNDGEFGFAPAIYIDTASAPAPAPAAAPLPPPMPARPAAADAPIPGEADWRPDPPGASNNPAAALAGLITQRTGGTPAENAQRNFASPPMPSRAQYTPEESEEEEAPPMPQRPQSQYASPRIPEPAGVMPSPPHNRAVSQSYDDDRGLRSPGGFHLYNIHEMVDYMGKSKKMPTTLGLNVAKGIIMISPEKSSDGPSKEWSADKLTHYSIEGKHVFVELVRPSKSVDFHAGAKDTAREIVAQLGELAGAVRAEGLREVMAASAGTGGDGLKKGKMLYEFMAQGDDEVSVAIDDEVIVLDDQKSEEWWMIRRMKTGKEGVVPSSYVEITGTVPRRSDTVSGLDVARGAVEQNRLEEERLTRDAARSGKKDAIPERGSSLAGDGSKSRSQRSSSSQAKSKPSSSRVRMWTDRSGTFKVEAEFIGLRENKIHLHKVNGVKIAVPVGKMSTEDLEYVEQVTGTSLDDEKPSSDARRRSTQKKKDDDKRRTNGAGASVERKDEYDWFDFFLGCGVNPQICERYAGAFAKDQMGPENLPDINEQLLRTLGLKEGDILRVMKVLNSKYDRAADGAPQPNGGGSLFSGEGGVLKNNTRKGRPAAPVQTNDVVSEDAFKQSDPASAAGRALSGDARATPLTSAPAREPKTGFEDDAWDVKPSRTQTPVAEPPKPVEPPKPKINDDLVSLAITSPPLQPTPAPPSLAPQQTAVPDSSQPSQPQGANQAIFDKIASLAPARQRPQPPPQQSVGAFGMPPPPRPISAPGYQQSMTTGYGPPAPLQPNHTGYQPAQQQFHPMQPQQTAFQGYPQQQTNGYGGPNGYSQPQNSVQAMQQNYPALQPQPTGLAFQPQSQFGAAQAAQHYGSQPGFGQQPPYQQQLVNGTQTGSPFADPPRQPFQSYPTGMQYQQQTGFGAQPSYGMPQPTGVNGFQGHPPPQLPPQQTGGVLGPIQPLVAQKTGPAPPIRFGVQPGASRLTPQPTGRANLANATPQNPFGF